MSTTNEFKSLINEGATLLNQHRIHCEKYELDFDKELRPTIESIQETYTESNQLLRKIEGWRKSASSINMRDLSKPDHEQMLLLKVDLEKSKSTLLELTDRSKKLVERLLELDRYSPTPSKGSPKR